MSDITISVSEDVREIMEELPKEDWSRIARDAIFERAVKVFILKSKDLRSSMMKRLKVSNISALRKKLEKLTLLDILDKMLENSKLTDKDCIELGEKIKVERYKFLKSKGLI